MMGFLLNKAADFLLLILWFFCNVIGTIFSFKHKEFDEWNEDKARAKDLYGNVLIKYVGNWLLITKDSKYKFGNPKQYISYVIGKNKADGTLTYLGSVIDGILEFFDPGHSLAAAGYRAEVWVPKYWFFSKVFWMKASMFVVFFFSGVHYFIDWNWLMWPVFAGFAYLFVLGMILIVYAFVINPIKNLKIKYDSI